MITKIITCDYCGKNINIEEEYITLDGYWNIQDKLIEYMNFHEYCWETLFKSFKHED